MNRYTDSGVISTTLRRSAFVLRSISIHVVENGKQCAGIREPFCRNTNTRVNDLDKGLRNIAFLKFVAPCWHDGPRHIT